MTIKERHTLFMSKRAWKSVEDNYKQDGCGTKNEFIEKAVHFYCGYLAADDASEYLPTVLSAVLLSSLESMKVKLGRLLFKQAVENNITSQLIRLIRILIFRPMKNFVRGVSEKSRKRMVRSHFWMI